MFVSGCKGEDEKEEEKESGFGARVFGFSSFFERRKEGIR